MGVCLSHQSTLNVLGKDYNHVAPEAVANWGIWHSEVMKRISDVWSTRHLSTHVSGCGLILSLAHGDSICWNDNSSVHLGENTKYVLLTSPEAWMSAQASLWEAAVGVHCQHFYRSQLHLDPFISEAPDVLRSPENRVWYNMHQSIWTLRNFRGLNLIGWL